MSVVRDGAVLCNQIVMIGMVSQMVKAKMAQEKVGSKRC